MKIKDGVISIHAPTRGATITDQSPVIRWMNFNPRSYKRSDGIISERISRKSLFQSTLLQEERRQAFSHLTEPLHISIHAPTRGATLCLQQSLPCRVISIHAPTRGATRTFMHNIMMFLISIHAPTRGATLFVRILIPSLLFQSTLLQEERHSPIHIIATARDFNPRSYKRSDMMAGSRSVDSLIFQSTLLQEERPESVLVGFLDYNFNPRSYKRSDSKNAQYSLCISAIIIA